MDTYSPSPLSPSTPYSPYAFGEERDFDEAEEKCGEEECYVRGVSMGHSRKNNSGPVDSCNYTFRAVIFSLIGEAKFIGCVVIIKSVVSSLFLALNLASSGIKYLSLTRKHDVARVSPETDKDKKLCLTKIHNLLAELKENGHCIISSALCMIPYVGVFGAGLYSSYMASKSLQSTTFSARCAEALTQHTLAPFLEMFPLIGSVAQKSLYFLTGQKSTAETSRIHKLKAEMLGAVPLTIPVERGDGVAHTISCYHIVQPKEVLDPPTIVIFHGNGVTGIDMEDTAKLYKERGCNVVLVTLGGYPTSDEGLQTTEATTIQDVHAVLRYLEGLGVENIGVHGLSLGASLAMHATQLSDKVKIAILDKPFDNVRNVAANVANNSLHKFIRLLLPPAIVKGIFGRAFPVGRMVPGVNKPDGSDYFTDGLDNRRKAKLFDHPLVCFGGSRDHLMGYNRVSLDGEFSYYSGNFAVDLSAAHNEATNRPRLLYIEPLAGHIGSASQMGGAYIDVGFRAAGLA